MLLSSSFRTITFFSLLLLAFSSSQAQTFQNYSEGELIVKYKTKMKNTQKASLKLAYNVESSRSLNLINAEVWEIEDDLMTQTINLLNNDPNIEYAEPNYTLYAIEGIQGLGVFTSGDPRVDDLWSLNNEGQTGGTFDADIDAFEAWGATTGSEEIIIGVIDTGVDWTHEDLAQNMWINDGEIPGNGIDDDSNGFIDDVYGYDFVNNDGNPMDDNYHGTHVAGTIAAVGDNDIGVAGVNWTAKIMALKFLDAGGSGSTDAAISAIEYSVLMGAHITNNSWGGGAFSSALQDAIEAAGDMGQLFVVAAGNDSRNNDTSPSYPASYPSDNILAVASTDHNDNLSGFSNYGVESVDIGAPGTDILSTTPGNAYSYLSGTSMASPHVAGVAGLVLSQNPGLLSGESRLIADQVVKARILETADPVPSLNGITATGARLNAFIAAAEPDSINPDPVSDLLADLPGSNSIGLSWTASGDDGLIGKAAKYIIRYSTSTIDEDNFDSATIVNQNLKVDTSGTSQNHTVKGLEFNTLYYFAIKVSDEWGNTSSISNIASKSTLGAPTISITPDSLYDNLLTGQISSQIVTISNTGEGTLDFEIGNVKSPKLLAQFQNSDADGNKNSINGSTDSKTSNTKSISDLEGDKILVIQDTDAWGLALEPFIEANFEVGAITVNSWDLSSTDLNEFDIVITVGDESDSYYNEISSNKSKLEDFASSGGFILYQLATQGSNVDVAGDVQVIFSDNENLNSIIDSKHPILSDISGPIVGNSANHTIINNLPDNANIITETSISNKPTTVEYSYNSGNIVVTGMTWEWLYFYDHPAALLQYNAIKYALEGAGIAKFLSATPTSGTINAGDSKDIEISFDAARLGTGSYLQRISVESNDPANENTFIATQLDVTGVQDILVKDDSVKFGPIFINTTDSLFLSITNAGTETLSVSNISSDDPLFVPFFSSTTIDLGSTISVPIYYSPILDGVTTAILTISSDDPDEPTYEVKLQGEAILPPEITISPDSLYANLLTGQVVPKIFTIDNTTGGSDLFVDISFEGIEETDSLVAIYKSSDLEGKITQDFRSKINSGAEAKPNYEVLQSLSNSNSSPKSTSPIAKASNGFLFSIDYSNGKIVESNPESGAFVNSFDLPEFGNSGPEGLAFDGDHLYYTNSFGSGAIYKLDKSTGELIKSITVPEIYSIDGLAHSGEFIYALNYDTNIIYVVDFEAEKVVHQFSPFTIGGGISYGGSRNSLFVASFEAGIFEINPETGDLLNSYDSPNFAQVYGLGYSNALGLLLVSTTDGYLHGLNPDTGEIEFSYSYLVATGIASDEASNLNWLSIVSSPHIIPAGETADVELSFDATGLFTDTFKANVNISSNDPINPSLNVTAVLDVTGVQDIYISKDSLSFAEIFVGDTLIQSITVQNIGTSDLDISDIFSANDAFYTNVTSTTLAPGEGFELLVYFNPLEAGDVESKITITSDDPDELTLEVKVNGSSTLPPVIEVSPTSLSSFLIAGQTETQIFNIDNTAGSTDLIFDLKISNSKVSEFGLFSEVTRSDSEIAELEVAQDNGSGVLSTPTISPYPIDSFKRLSGSLDLLVWNAYSDNSFGGELENTLNAISQYYTDFNLTLTSTENPDELKALLDNADVFIVPEQELGYGPDLYNLGVAFTPALDTFLDRGGNMIVLEHFNSTYLFLNGTGFMNITGGGAHSGLAVNVTDESHPLMEGVPSSFVASNGASTFESSDEDVLVIEPSTNNPVIIQKPYRNGNVTLIGFDFYSYNADMARILANAVVNLSGASFFTLSQQSGSVPEGSSLDIEVTFDATEIPPSKYEATIIVQSNDPVTKTVPVSIELSVLQEGSMDIPLQENWNLISFNVQPEFSDADEVLGDILENTRVVLGFDGTGLTYDPSLDSDFNTLTSFESRNGYWFKMLDPDILSIDGYIQAPDTPIELAEGFNLIGYLSQDVDSLTHALSSIMDNVEIVLGFNGGGLAWSPDIPNEFNTLQYLEPGFGYWVKLSQADTLVYPDSGIVGIELQSKILSSSQLASKQKSHLSTTPTRNWITVWGNGINLGNEPIPVGTIVKAFDSQGNVAGHSIIKEAGKLHGMSIYRDDPISDKDEGADVNEYLTLTFGDVEIQNALQWKAHGEMIDVVTIVTGIENLNAIPKAFALEQNYPNPFNPATIIKYALPARAKVTIEVFNTLGQRVAVLLDNQEQPASFHSIRFDAQSLASGMYIYRIKAGRFVATKKMLLIK